MLFDWRTVAKEHLATARDDGLGPRAGAPSACRRLLELVELVGFGDHHPWQLSGGMQQRPVSIAQALSFDPALLLMDEPFVRSTR